MDETRKRRSRTEQNNWVTSYSFSFSFSYIRARWLYSDRFDYIHSCQAAAWGGKQNIQRAANKQVSFIKKSIIHDLTTRFDSVDSRIARADRAVMTLMLELNSFIESLPSICTGIQLSTWIVHAFAASTPHDRLWTYRTDDRWCQLGRF